MPVFFEIPEEGCCELGKPCSYYRYEVDLEKPSLAGEVETLALPTEVRTLILLGRNILQRPASVQRTDTHEGGSCGGKSTPGVF